MSTRHIEAVTESIDLTQLRINTLPDSNNDPMLESLSKDLVILIESSHDTAIIGAAEIFICGEGAWGQAQERSPIETKKVPHMEKKAHHKEKSSKRPPHGE